MSFVCTVKSETTALKDIREYEKNSSDSAKQEDRWEEAAASRGDSRLRSAPNHGCSSPDLTASEGDWPSFPLCLPQ